MSSDALVFHHCWEYNDADGYVDKCSVVVLSESRDIISLAPVGAVKPFTGRILFSAEDLEKILEFLRKGNGATE